MPEEVALEDVMRDIKKYAKEIREGKIFVYPTDTIYGIGGNANLKDVCEKIYKIKSRPKDKPLSVIAPSEEWIMENFDVSKYILRLYFPGPYTLLLKKKNKDFLSHASTSLYVGVRIPDHPITILVNHAGVPLITTSANLSGYPPVSRYEDLDERITMHADYIIKGKCKFGKPSTIINPYTEEIIRK